MRQQNVRYTLPNLTFYFYVRRTNGKYWNTVKNSELRLAHFPTSNTETPRKVFYFHVNGSIGIVQKIDFEIRPNLGCTTPKSRKVVLDNPSVCVSVCLSGRLSVFLSLFPRALTGVRFNRSS